MFRCDRGIFCCQIYVYIYIHIHKHIIHIYIAIEAKFDKFPSELCSLV